MSLLSRVVIGAVGVLAIAWAVIQWLLPAEVFRMTISNKRTSAIGALMIGLGSLSVAIWA